jgi:o-succinylbenzoate---CoA ligase
VTRQLVQHGGDSLAPALRSALAGSGPAVFAGVGAAGLPATVPQRVALVVQSSGSTARPKRVALSADALLAAAAASESFLGGPGQWLLALPQTYIAGIGVLVRSLAADTQPRVMDPVGFTAARFVEEAERMDHALRFTSLVPAQLARLLDAPEALPALRRFDRILVGGQATPPPLLDRALAEGLRVTRTYGSSETAGGCVYDGVPIGATEIRVTDQIEISGPTLAEGYLDDELTARAFVMAGSTRWYRSGDLGSFENGVLSVSGRVDDLIVSGGVKVSLGELERLVRTATPLVDAVVVPADDARWGQVPVVVATGSMQLAALRSIAIAALGVAAAPAQLVTVDSIPLLASGKPDRLALRAAVDR